MTQYQTKSITQPMEFIGEDSLSHHGILGMKWGQRNGPPYPLTTWQQRAGDAVARGRAAVSRVLNDYVAKAKAKVEVEAAKRRAVKEEMERRNAQDRDRQRLIKMAKKNPGLLTDQELRQLNDRAQAENNFKKNYDPDKKSDESTKQIKNTLVKDFITPTAVALGKSAVAAVVGGGDFQKIASVQLGQAWNKAAQNNQNKGKDKKPELSKKQPNMKGKKDKK